MLILTMLARLFYYLCGFHLYYVAADNGSTHWFISLGKLHYTSRMFIRIMSYFLLWEKKQPAMKERWNDSTFLQPVLTVSADMARLLRYNLIGICCAPPFNQRSICALREVGLSQPTGCRRTRAMLQKYQCHGEIGAIQTFIDILLFVNVLIMFLPASVANLATFTANFQLLL